MLYQCCVSVWELQLKLRWWLCWVLYTNVPLAFPWHQANAYLQTLLLSLSQSPHITYFWSQHPHCLLPTLQKGPTKIAWLCGSGWSCCSEQVQTDRAIAIATEVVCEIPGNQSSSSSSSPTYSGPFSDFFPLFFSPQGASANSFLVLNT